MEFPEDTLLPFFAYGAFRPGEIAFLRLKPYVERIEHDCQTNGELLLRDGLAILDSTPTNFVKGSLLYFVPKSGGKAYYRIEELEPDKQYKWGEIDVETRTGVQRANALLGINLPNGCASSDRPFTSKSDPLFKEAFAVPSHETGTAKAGFQN